MKRLINVLTFVLFSVSAAIAQMTDLEASRYASTVGLNAESAASARVDSSKLDSILLAYKSSIGVPGIASRIVRDGKVIWDKNYGFRNRELQLPVEDSTLFLLASVSKLFVATAVMQLWENGLVDLDRDINTYLPSALSVRNPFFLFDSMTIRMMLTHTSSLSNPYQVLNPLTVCGDHPTELDSFLLQYLEVGGSYYSTANFNSVRPGAQYLYTSIGPSLLAVMVEHVTGMSFEQYCRDSIFTPLSMNATSWFLGDTPTDDIAVPYSHESNPLCHLSWVLYPSLNLRSSKIELSNFLTAYLDGGVFEGKRILDSTTVASMLSHQASSGTEGFDQGLMWFRYAPVGETVWGHNGAWNATETYVAVSPSEKFTVILLQNQSEGFGPPFPKLENMVAAMIDYASEYGEVFAAIPSIDKSYISNENDTLLFTTTFANECDHPFTANVLCSFVNGAVIDSFELCDDGLNGDCTPNDGVYGRRLTGLPAGKFYSLGVSTLDGTTHSYRFDADVARFTTAGPLKLAYSECNRVVGNYHRVRPHVTNLGADTIRAASMRVRCDDPWASIQSNEIPLPDIPPGGTVTSSGGVLIESTLPVESTYFNLEVDLLCGGWMYWSDAGGATGVGGVEVWPTEYSLYQNVPNPFNPATQISYALPVACHVTLRIFDLLGREVATLVNEERSAGRYTAIWDASEQPSGVYYSRMTSGEFTMTKRMVLLR